MSYPRSPHPLPRGVNKSSGHSERSIPVHFRSGEPQCQSPKGSLSLMDGEPYATALWALYPTPAGVWPLCKQADDADPEEAAYGCMLLVFQPFPHGILRWAFWTWSCKTRVSCSLLIHRNLKHFGRELKRIFFFHSVILAECHPDLVVGGRTEN